MSREDPAGLLSSVLTSAKHISGYQEPVIYDEPVFTGWIQRDGYTVDKYFVKGEGDYVIPYLLLVPEKAKNKELIYLHLSGKVAEVAEEGETEWFVTNGFIVLAPDIIMRVLFTILLRDPCTPMIFLILPPILYREDYS